MEIDINKIEKETANAIQGLTLEQAVAATDGDREPSPRKQGHPLYWARQARCLYWYGGACSLWEDEHVKAEQAAVRAAWEAGDIPRAAGAMAAFQQKLDELRAEWRALCDRTPAFLVTRPQRGPDDVKERRDSVRHYVGELAMGKADTGPEAKHAEALEGIWCGAKDSSQVCWRTVDTVPTGEKPWADGVTAMGGGMLHPVRIITRTWRMPGWSREARGKRAVLRQAKRLAAATGKSLWVAPVRHNPQYWEVLWDK